MSCLKKQKKESYIMNFDKVNEIKLMCKVQNFVWYLMIQLLAIKHMLLIILMKWFALHVFATFWYIIPNVIIASD